MEETNPPKRTVTTGVRPFLKSRVGGWILNAVVGTRSLRKTLEKQGAHYEFIVGGVGS